MEKINGNDNKQLIEAAKERLRWYTLEASEEEFDEEEVDALVNLLHTLEPIESKETQSDEAALERFRAYVQMREAEDGMSVVEAPAEKKENNKLVLFVNAHKFIAAAAAIFIVIMVAGGSLGAVNASKGNGFFFWLRKDDKGMTMITSPENMDGNKDIEGEKKYSSVEEVPEEYREYLIDIDSIEQLQEYELKYITVKRTESYYDIKRCFENDLGENQINIGTVIYEDKIRLTYEAYLGEKNENDEQEGVLVRKNPSGDIEGMVYFYEGNVQYYVEGNIDEGMLLEIATEYRNIVSK